LGDDPGARRLWRAPPQSSERGAELAQPQDLSALYCPSDRRDRRPLLPPAAGDGGLADLASGCGSHICRLAGLRAARRKAAPAPRASCRRPRQANEKAGEIGRRGLRQRARWQARREYLIPAKASSISASRISPRAKRPSTSLGKTLN